MMNGYNYKLTEWRSVTFGVHKMFLRSVPHYHSTILTFTSEKETIRNEERVSSKEGDFDKI